ncbi:hypothetical protein FACS1894125_5330 [Actinomycetota bacterium]|nr:hypothetical protein FACS1894125_5330 [Actinomycetota bacterium]
MANTAKKSSKSDALKKSILQMAVDGKLTGADTSKWVETTLGDCCSVLQTGNSISKNTKEVKYVGLKSGINYIATKDVEFNQKINYENGVKIPYQEVSSFRVAKAGSVLLCIEGGSAGRKISILDQDVCYGNKLACLTSTFSKYLYYFLQSPSFLDVFAGEMSGIIGGISIRNLKALPIHLPPLAEQHAIVAKLDEILPLVERYAELEREREHLNVKLQPQLRRSILNSAIAGALTNEDTSTWKETKLGEVGIWKAGSTPLKSKSEYYANGTIPWLVTGDLNNGHIGSVPKTVTEKALAECSLQLNPVGSILIAMYGATIGKLGILDIESTTNQACLACVPNDKINGSFLFYYLMSQKKTFEESAEGGAQPNISRQKIVAWNFSLPPLQTQTRIVAKVDQFFTQLDRLETKL